MASDYRFATAILVRTLGALLALAGLLVLLVAALVAVLDLPVTILTVVVVAALVGVVAVVVAATVATRRRSLVHLDDDGYRVRWLRRAGVKQARWRDVEDVVTARISGHDCVVLRLRDGRTTTIPVVLLDASPAALVQDLSARLDKGRGYRRLR